VGIGENEWFHFSGQGGGVQNRRDT